MQISTQFIVVVCEGFCLKEKGHYKKQLKNRTAYPTKERPPISHIYKAISSLISHCDDTYRRWEAIIRIHVDK